MQWSTLNGISQSKPVKSVALWFVIVPIVAKLLHTVERYQELNVFGLTISLDMSLPFQWHVLFYSSCFFLTSSILYQFFCPNFIKKYEDYKDFNDRGKSRVQLGAYLLEVMKPIFSQKVSEYSKEVINSYLTHYGKNGELNASSWEKIAASIDSCTANGKDSDAFYYVYEIANRKWQPVIWLVSGFYLAGFACLAIIAFQNIVYVIQN